MTTFFLMIGTTELVLIAGLALLLFGGKKLPEMMKGLGQGVRNFKQGMNEQPVEEPQKETEGEQQPSDQVKDTQTEKAEEDVSK